MIVGVRARTTRPPGASTASCPQRSIAGPRRLAVRIVASNSKDGKEKPPSDGKKADFSAYWSLKIREFFSNRRKFLEEIDRKGIPEPEIAKKFEIQAEEQAVALFKLEEEEQQLKQVKLQARRQLEEQAAVDAKLRKKTGVVPADAREAMSPAAAAAETERDIEQARANLRTAAVAGFALNMHRAREVIRMVLLFPITLAKAIQQQWSALYNSQRYENFLMSEGERIWYWRNRTENERWFWEIAFWDRLALPILCTIAYEFLVPNHFIWAVVVPLTFIFIQSGELPSVRGIEFWLIAYFGFYLKCWPDCSALLKMVFQF